MKASLIDIQKIEHINETLRKKRITFFKDNLNYRE